MSYTFESVYALTKENIEDVEWEMVNSFTSPMYRYLSPEKVALIEEFISDKLEPSEIEDFCSYEMTMLYHKEFKSFKQMNKNDEVENVDDSNSRTNKQKHKFKKTHPGTIFSYLKKLKLPVIPKISLPHLKFHCHKANFVVWKI